MEKELYEEFKNIIKNIIKKGKNITLDVLEEMISSTKQFCENFNLDLLKCAWNYEEKSTKFYTFEDAIKWVKNNYPKIKTDIMGACIYKEIKKDIIMLHICYMNNNEEPLLDGNYSHILVKCLEMDKELIIQFGDKDLLLIR